MKKAFSAHSEKTTPIVLYFAILTIIVYGLKIQPILFNDDWWHLANIQSPEFSLITERRPLHSIVLWFLLKLSPSYQSIRINYYLQVILIYLVTLSVFFLTKEIFKHNLPSFLVASLYLVYPNDYTQLYITTSGIRLSVLLLFVSMILFAQVFQYSKRINHVLIIPLLFSSFLMYEGQLGVAVIWPIVLAFLFRQKISKEILLDIFLYYVPMFFFIIWRLLVQPRYYADNKLAYLSAINFQEIIYGYLDALRIILAGFSFPYEDLSWLTMQNLLVIGLAFLSLCSGFLLLKRRTVLFTHNHQEKDFFPVETPNIIKMIISAGILWGAGYFPIILNYPPNIYGHLSRVNIFSILGSTLLVITSVMLLLSVIKQKTNLYTNALSFIVLSLAFWAAIIQIQVQEAYNNSWEDAKVFYNALFETAPNIKDNSYIILLFDGYDNSDGITRPVFSTSWEPKAVFEVLYEKENLEIYYQYDKREIPAYPKENSFTSTLYTSTIEPIEDLSKLIVLRYDKATATLSIVDKVFKRFQSEASFGEYNPEDRIIPLENPIVNRKLVN